MRVIPFQASFVITSYLFVKIEFLNREELHTDQSTPRMRFRISIESFVDGIGIRIRFQTYQLSTYFHPVFLQSFRHQQVEGIGHLCFGGGENAGDDRDASGRMDECLTYWVCIAEYFLSKLPG